MALSGDSLRSFNAATNPATRALSPDVLKELVAQSKDSGGGPGFFSQGLDAGLGVAGGVLDWLSRPGQSIRSLLAAPGELLQGDVMGALGRVVDAGEHATGFVADGLTGGQFTRAYGHLAGEDWTTRSESPEFTDLMKLYTGSKPEGGWGFAADVIGGALTDPLTYVSGVGGAGAALGRGGIAGAGRQSAKSLLARGLMQTTKGRASLLTQLGSRAGTNVVNAINSQSLKGLMENSLALVDDAAEQIASGRMVGPVNLGEDLYRNTANSGILEGAIKSLADDGMLQLGGLQVGLPGMAKRAIPGTEALRGALPGAFKHGAAPASLGEVAGGVLGLPAGVGAAAGIASRKLAPTAWAKVDDMAAKAWGSAKASVYDKFASAGIPEGLRETARQFWQKKQGADAEALNSTRALFHGTTEPQRRAVMDALIDAERQHAAQAGGIAPPAKAPTVKALPPARVLGIKGWEPTDLGDVDLYRGERFAPLELGAVGTISNVKRPQPWDFIGRPGETTIGQAAAGIRKALGAMRAQKSVSRALRGEFGSWQKKRLGMLKAGLVRAEKMARVDPVGFAKKWAAAEGKLRVKFSNEAFWGSTSPRVARAYQDQLSSIFGPELSAMFRRPAGTRATGGLFKATAALNNSLDLGRYAQGVIPEADAISLAVGAGLPAADVAEMLRFNKEWARSRGQELAGGQLAVETLFRGRPGEKLLSSLEDLGYDSIRHVSWGFKDPDVAVIRRGSLKSLEEIGGEHGGRRLDLRAAGAPGGSPASAGGPVTGSAPAAPTVESFRQSAVTQAALKAGISRAHAKGILDELFRGFDKQQDELLDLGLFKRSERSVYVPHVVNRELAERFAEKGVQRGEGMSFGSFADKHVRTRKSGATLEEFEESIRKLANAEGVSLEGIDEIAVRDVADLMHTRQVAHNETMWRQGLRNYTQQYAGASAKLDSGSAIDQYVKNLTQGMKGRNLAGKILATASKYTKPLQTVYRPAFHARNMVSTWAQVLLDPAMTVKDSFKIMAAQVGDMPLIHVLSKKSRSQGAVYKFLTAANKPLDKAAQEAAGAVKIGRYSGDEVLKLARGGVLQNNFGEEILEQLGVNLRAVMGDTKPKGVGKRALGKLNEVATNVSAYVEDRARMTAFVGLLEKGMPAPEAIRRTQRMFVNYDVQSSMDRLLRDVVPYARFSVGNTPVVISEVARRPGLIAPHVAASQSVRNNDPLAPEQARLGMALPAGDGDYLGNFGLPQQAAMDVVNGLTSLEGGRKMLSSTNPVISTPLQKLTNTNFYFGGDFDRPTAAPDWLPAVGPVRDTAYGGKEFSPGMSQLLFSSPIAPISSAIRTTNTKGAATIISKLLTGAGIIERDESRVAQKAVEAWLEGAKRRGDLGKVTNFYQRGTSPEAIAAAEIAVRMAKAKREARKQEGR